LVFRQSQLVVQTTLIDQVFKGRRCMEQPAAPGPADEAKDRVAPAHGMELGEVLVQAEHPPDLGADGLALG
jgi:hypothetical protein